MQFVKRKGDRTILFSKLDLIIDAPFSLILDGITMRYVFESFSKIKCKCKKTLTDGLLQVGRVRQPNWDPRDHQARRTEILIDMAK